MRSSPANILTCALIYPSIAGSTARCTTGSRSAICVFSGLHFAGTEVRRFEPKIVASILEADVTDHLPQPCFILGELAVLHISADDLAEDATKILVARERHERA